MVLRGSELHGPHLDANFSVPEPEPLLLELSVSPGVTTATAFHLDNGCSFPSMLPVSCFLVL